MRVFVGWEVYTRPIHDKERRRIATRVLCGVSGQEAEMICKGDGENKPLHTTLLSVVLDENNVVLTTRGTWQGDTAFTILTPEN